jgi:hypothetical protein
LDAATTVLRYQGHVPHSPFLVRKGLVDGEDLREGIFALNTRRFGSVAEVLIQRLKKLGKAKNLFHDLYDDLDRKRVEVKFSRALKKSDVLVTPDTVLQCIESATSENRLVAWEEREVAPYDCNIQQVKRAEFDVLYYGIFFSNAVVIFHIASDEIGPQIYYSDKQHKGNVGEGQFHVNHDTIGIHVNNYLYRKLSYEELLEVLA